MHQTPRCSPAHGRTYATLEQCGSARLIAPQVNQGLTTNNYRDILNTYWQHQVTKLETDEHDYKLHQLPLARIKKVMKADPEVKMISAEAPILFAKGCDIFITELTMRAWIHAEENKRRTLQRSDIASALSKSDMFDFLIDIVPREEANSHKRTPGAGNAAVQSSAAAVPPGAMPSGVPQQHQMPPPDYMGQHMAPQDDFRPPGMYAGPVQGDHGAYGQPPMFDPAVYGAYNPMAQQQVRITAILPCPVTNNRLADVSRWTTRA
jgi:nuclear transcription factor Y gamma